MSTYDEQYIPDNDNKSKQHKKLFEKHEQQSDAPYSTDHLPQLANNSAALEFKPLGQINAKASKDRQTKLLLEEGEQKTRGWQLTKQEFIAQIEQMVDTKVNGLLKYVGFSTKDCPWLQAFYSELNTYSASGIEQLLRQYLGQNIESTNDFLAKLGERVEAPVKHWIKTREIQDVPELVEQKMAETQPGGTNGHFNPFAKASQSPGSIPPELRAKLEEFLGASLSSIKLHAGSEAEKVLQDKNARALTVGQDIYLDLSKYSLQTPEGIGILAHEIIHAQQQIGATGMDTSNNSEALEKDANRNLWTLLRRWMKWGKGFATRASMKSGLKVAKCGKDEEVEGFNAYSLKEHFMDSDNKKSISYTHAISNFHDMGANTYKTTNRTHHSLGDYNYVEGSHAVHGGNTAAAIIARYYGRYLGFDPKDQTLFSNKVNLNKAKNFWDRVIVVWNRDRLQKKGYTGDWNKIPSGVDLIVNPFAYRRSENILLKNNRKNKQIQKNKGKENVTAYYILKYTTGDKKGADFDHSFTSITYEEVDGHEVIVTQKAVLNNASLNIKSSIDVEGIKVNNGEPIELDHVYQIPDDILWLHLNHLRYYIQYVRNRQKSDPMSEYLSVNKNNQEMFLGFMNPNQSTSRKTDPLKKPLTIATQVQAALATGVAVLNSYFTEKKLVHLLITFPPTLKVVTLFGALIASYFLKDKVEANEVVLYKSE